MSTSRSPKATRRPNGFLQSGSATGHFHQAQGVGVAVMERGPDEVWLEASKGAFIVHQEHNPFAVEARPDGYDRPIVREYDHFLEESRAVQD